MLSDNGNRKMNFENAQVPDAQDSSSTPLGGGPPRRQEVQPRVESWRAGRGQLEGRRVSSIASRCCHPVAICPSSWDLVLLFMNFEDLFLLEKNVNHLMRREAEQLEGPCWPSEAACSAELN